MTNFRSGTRQPHRGELSMMPGEDFDAWVIRLRQSTVVDPELLGQERRRLAAEAERRSEAVRARLRSAWYWLLSSFLAGLISVTLHYGAGLSSWPVIGSSIAFVLGVVYAAVAARPPAVAPACPAPNIDHVVRFTELDQRGRHLLDRLQSAMKSLLTSAVYRENLLDRSAGEAALRSLEWETTVELRRITVLRAAHDASPVDGPRTAKRLESQERLLTRAERQAAAKVGAVESYAEQVRQAEAALNDERGASRVSELNGAYLDLIAKTMTSGDRAIAELSEMSEQAVAATQVFRNEPGPPEIADDLGAGA
jgi:hypothetical protein